MWKTEGIILLLNLAYVSMQLPNPGKIPQRKCTHETRILNDCNWCYCDNTNFRCAARDCHSVDMFGHFKDTIQDIDVGMGGHGSWRSTSSACEAGVHYRRNEVLCVCNEDGNWPSPVCRDLFRVLHFVETTNVAEPSRGKKCSPSKLYLMGCNVCFCPMKGVIDPELCTARTCDKNDPVLLNDVELENKVDKETEVPVTEVYAQCTLDIEYNVGCQNCACLRNNRLLCDNCTDSSKRQVRNVLPKSFCSNKKPGEVFSNNCNLCFCDETGNAFCTIRKCLSGSAEDVVFTKLDSLPLTSLAVQDIPFDAFECVPGTKFNRDCNSCTCLLSGREKFFSCSLKQCSESADVLSKLKNDCVEGTIYESNCLVCSCKVEDGVKWERCYVNELCLGRHVNSDKKSQDLESLHGYCEPLHVYNNDCNTCRCLSDGKIVQCTTETCERIAKPQFHAQNVNDGKKSNIDNNGAVTVDIIPVKVEKGEKCPQGYSYKIDCNFCYCLMNGNALCTTKVCH